MAQNKIWENPKVLEINGLPMHVPLWFYSNENSAREGACISHLPFMNGGACGDNESSEIRCLTKNVWRLDKGWEFRLFDTFEDTTGYYKVELTITEQWMVDDLQDGAEYSIIFHGVESTLFVHVNKNFVGFSKDSRLPCEFSITLFLNCKDETTSKARKYFILDTVVPRFSDGSYMDDKDQWRITDIHRQVEIIRRPRKKNFNPLCFLRPS